MQKKIIHIDMDAFYVSVEIRDNPELLNKPVAVGGESNRRSVLSTCNYHAREYGVYSAMPSRLALAKCPDLVILPSRMHVYKQVSEQLHQILKRYTDKVEGLSLDEAYLDVSHCNLFEGSATLIAQDIRESIFNELSLTASAGVAPLKYLAKIASDLNKPDGQYVISPPEVIPFINKMRLSQISGVGKVSFTKLVSHGFEYGQDVRMSNEHFLIKAFGKLGSNLWFKCQGVDTREIEVSKVRKSIGVETTFLHDLTELNEMLAVLNDQLIPKLKKRASKYLSLIESISIKIKFNDFHLTTKTCQFTSIDKKVCETLLIAALSRGKGKSVRLIGIQAGLEKPNKQSQLSLF